MAITYINGNTATISDLLVKVNDTIQQVNLLLLGQDAIVTDATTLGGHAPDYFAVSTRTITGVDLVTGSGTLAGNTVLTVS